MLGFKSGSNTYNQITAKMIIYILVATLAISFVYTEYLKKEVIINLAKADAKKTSRLVFESMYSAMQKGWNKEEIQEIIDRLNNVDTNLDIFIYRGEKVSELFGEIEKDKLARESSSLVSKTFQGEENIKIDDSNIIEYFFPITANDKCQKCHINSKPGDVLGVININYPITDLKVSLTDMINLFLVFIIIFSIVIFTLLLLNFNKYLLKPIGRFVKTANIIKKSTDLSQRVEIEHDIDEIKSMQLMFNEMLDSIEHQFYYDHLTGLRNRRSLLETLELHKDILFMIINIDKFQQINSLYGNEIGDTILLNLRDKIREMLPKTCELFKLHADEFGVISKNTLDLKEFETIAYLITENISKYEFTVNNKECILINLTIGISHGSTLLLPNADMALKLAKKEKKNYLIYTEQMRELREYEKRISWTKRISKAIEEDRIVPFFQPIIDCKTSEVVKYESLIRMKVDDEDYISPIHFLDISKENKLYFKLTLIMLKKVFALCKDTGYNFSINLTKEDMRHDEIVNYILDELDKYSYGEKITFEILESEGIENFQEIKQFIDKVKKHDVRISIDDFGTGYSNFEYLLNLNFDYLKIDSSMIKNIDHDERSQMITKTIVDFAQKIGVKTVAEFVSSEKIFNTVQEINIDYAQGYYFGEPTSTIE